MPSTLTARIEYGKQSGKFERNTRKEGFCEILLCVMLLIVGMFAQCFKPAQSTKKHSGEGRVAGLSADFAVTLRCIRGQARSTGSTHSNRESRLAREDASGGRR